MKVRNLVFCACACMAVGCGSSKGGGTYKPSEIKTVPIQKVAAGDGPTLFPVAVGNQWTFESVSEANVQGQPRVMKQNVTMEIKKVDETAQGKQITMEVREDDVVKSTQVWRMDDTGLYQVSVTGAGKTGTFSPAQPVLPFPIEDGKIVEYQGTGPSALGISSSFKGKVTLDGAQLTDTATDQVSAYRVASLYELKGQATDTAGKKVPLAGVMESIAWFSPKLGMVRLQQVVRGQAGAEKVTLTLLQSTVK